MLNYSSKLHVEDLFQCASINQKFVFDFFLYMYVNFL